MVGETGFEPAWPKVIIDGEEYTSGTNPSYKYL